jgi:hypothetical protein
MNSNKTFKSNVLVSVSCIDCGKEHALDTDTSKPCACGGGVAAPGLDLKKFGWEHDQKYYTRIRFEHSVNKGHLFDL